MVYNADRNILHLSVSENGSHKEQAEQGQELSLIHIYLDTFMASGEHVCELYARHAVSADVCIVEGMMGTVSYTHLDVYKRQI